jgi:hypothetical protein
MLFLFSALVFTTKTFAQSPCGSVNCTSNDVQVLSAYISAPGDKPINCDPSNPNPFDNAELHLIVSSNTQRIGISMMATLNITDNSNNVTGSFNFANCFTGVQLNNGSNNNLVYSLGHTLSTVQCGPGFTLSNVFISWGTGNTDFCNASTNPECPATPAKCRYKPNQVIPVEVKLEVDFSWVAGVCANGGNSLTLDFTPSVTTQQNLTYPLTFNWDFGDGNTATTTASSLADVVNAGVEHTYTTPNTYNVKLVGSDASPFFSKTAVHSISVIACCNVPPPVLSVQNNCGFSTITATDSNNVPIPAGELTWSNGATGNPIKVTTTDQVTASVTVGNCISNGSDAVTPAPKTVPSAPVLSVADNCGSSSITAKDGGGNLISSDELTWSNSATGNPITVTTTDQVTATITVSGCISNTSNSVTPAPKTVPLAPVLSVTDNCGSSSISATDANGNAIPSDELTWSNGATGNPITVTITDQVTATVTVGGCISGASKAGTPNPKTVPSAPVLSVANNCGSSSITAKDGGGNLISSDELTWSNNATGNPITVTTTDQVTATVTVGGCISSASNSAAPSPKTVPSAPVLSVTNNCGSSTITAKDANGNLIPSGGLTWSNGANGNPITVTNTTGVTATVTAGDCKSSASNSVTPAPNPVPSCPLPSSQTTGVGQSVNFSAPSGSNYTYSWSFVANTAGATFSGGATTAITPSVTVTTTTKGYYKLSLKVTDNTYSTGCNSTCIDSVAVNTNNGFYTYTQGYYSSTGTSCTPLGGAKGAVALIQYALDNTDGVIGSPAPHNEQMVFGLTNHSFTLNYADAAALVTIMPGGGTAAVLSGILSVTNVPLKSGKISNVLLSQTITLGLNINIQGDGLKNLTLKTGYLTTQKGDLSTCPTTKVIPCSKDAGSISSLQIATSTGMKTWIAGKTVNDLLNLASSALGGGTLPTGLSLSDITNAIDAINKSFDGGRFFLGFYTTAQTCSTISSAVASSISVNRNSASVTQLTVKAYPNPFQNKVNFTFTSPVSGTAVLEVYDLLGNKLAIVYQGKVDAGAQRTISYNVPAGSKVPMMYRITVGDKTSHALLIPAK